MTIDIGSIIISFLNELAEGVVEIYNEISLEHELGIHLRDNLPSYYKVQFERPVDYFNLSKTQFIKREIDISIFGPDKFPRHAIELKYPRAGQHPEQMFKSCQDIAFIEQLVSSGFSKSYFLILAENPLFFRGDVTSGIYSFFRAGAPITGRIQKPTGSRDDVVFVEGSYQIQWVEIGNEMRYALVEI